MKDEVCGFRCTGYDGSKVWAKLHSLPKEIDCPECAHHAEELFTGIHDHVSAGLGKKPKNQMNYKKFTDEVACTYKKCVESGQCE